MEEPLTTIGGTSVPSPSVYNNISPSVPSSSRHRRTTSTRSAISYPQSRGRPLEQLDYHSIPRNNTSPDRASITSSTLTTATTPHLRKKPNLNAFKLGHPSRAASVIETSSSSYTQSAKKLASPLKPAFGSDQVSTFSQPSNKEHLRVVLARTNSVPSPPRRPPASHSSYGVETTSGPPPSYSTQRTLSQERIRPVDRPRSRRMSISNERSPESGISKPPEPVQNSTDYLIQPTPLHIQSSPDTADTQSIPTPTDGEEIMAPDMREDHGLGVSNGEEDAKTSSDSPRSEDLFLNIAKVDATQPSSSRSERRRTRISLPFLSNNRSGMATKTTPSRTNFDSPVTASRDDGSQQFRKRSSLGQHTPSYSRTPQARQEVEDETSEQDQILPSDAVSSAGRRPATFNPDTSRPGLRIGTGARNRLVSEPGHIERPKTLEHLASESTISTTAPSTVWDELDDLKSRIRKLELTGKLPPSSAAAMSNVERPRTATTAATTMSGSPKHQKAVTAPRSVIEGVPSSLHPLLHEALGSAKGIVPNEVYQKLQATASDALQLASLLAHENPTSRAGINLTTERQIRRRTESMCRSLTELTIALASEQKLAQPQSAARESFGMPNVTLRSRRYSNEPSDRPPVSTRVQSRLDSRRTSLQYGNSHVLGLKSPESPAETSAIDQSRPLRTSTAFRNRRTSTFQDGNGDDTEDTNVNLRPVSRAMTDTAPLRRHTREFGASPREYTSQQPLPISHTHTDEGTTLRTPMSAGSTSNFTSRRKYGSPTIAGPVMSGSSPLGPREPWGRITIVSPDTNKDYSSVGQSPGYFGHPQYQHAEATGTPGSARSVSTRKSFGFASRIGSSVGSRLRAVKAGNNNREGLDLMSYEGGTNVEQQ